MIGHSLERSFVVEKQPTQETQIIRGNLNIVDGCVDISDVLEQIGSPQLKIYRIYDFSDQRYHYFREYSEDISRLPCHLFHPEIILLKYEQDISETHTLQSGTMRSQTSSSKKERSKERSISEVIEIVKYWRDLHSNHIKGKKLNLQEAAEVVGISKKSLDDYYYQLRLGEKYDFDFMANLNQKVGVLRNFIKDARRNRKNEDNSKMQKHPKSLQIFNYLGDIAKTSASAEKKRSPNCEEDGIYFEEMDEEIKKNNHTQNMMDVEDEVRSIQSIQDQFYNDFEFLGEEPADPFLNFEGNFKKKHDGDDKEKKYMSELLF